MALTDPFPADVEAWLEEPVQHLYEVTVLPVTGPPWEAVVVDRFDLTFDMEWSPFIQASLTIATPTDPADLASLDGRLGTSLRFREGYRHAGTDHWGDPITLLLHTADTAVPGITTDLTAHGAEMRLQDRNSLKEGPASFDNNIVRTGLDPFIRHWIERAYWGTTAPTIVSTIPGGTWNSHLVSQYVHDGGSHWSAIEGPARAGGVRVYDDGAGVWHIDPLPALSGTYALQLTTGRKGTLTSADTSVNRERWHNYVYVQWEWVSETGAPNALGAAAQVTSGPFRVTASNRREYSEYRPGPVTSGYAQAFVNALLAKFMLRGRQKSVTAAAAYWLRPGQTIRTRLGSGAWEDALVSAVTFSPLTGSMSVRTTRPEEYETGA